MPLWRLAHWKWCSDNRRAKKLTSHNTAYPVQEFFTFIIQGKKNSFSQIFVPLSLHKNFGWCRYVSRNSAVSQKFNKCRLITYNYEKEHPSYFNFGSVLLVILLLAWAPWLNEKEIHDKVFQEKAYKDGTMGWVIYPDGTKEYELICDYKVSWFPFGRIVELWRWLFCNILE